MDNGVVPLHSAHAVVLEHENKWVVTQCLLAYLQIGTGKRAAEFNFHDSEC